jgi:DNA-binding transcriptional ArsR family regulator
MDTREFSKYFKAFADQSRLTILQLLSGREMTVGEITEKLGLTQPTVSRHLAVLRAADVVRDRRQGQQVYYSLNKTTVAICCNGFCDCLRVEPAARSKSGKKK